MRRRHQNGTGSGSAAWQRGKSCRHQRRRGLGVRHLLRLLVLLAAQQGGAMVDGSILGRFILQPAAVAGGFLLAPQAAQAQCSSLSTPTITTVSSGAKQLTVSWNALTTGQSAVARWLLQYRKTGTTSWTTVSVSGGADARSYTITELDDGTGYQVRLIAVQNTFCQSNYSTIATGTTTSAAPAPAAPTGLRAAAGNAQVTLTWDDPEDDDITEYKVRYGKKTARRNAEWATIDGSDDETTTHRVTGLDNNAEYSFKVRAVSSAGDGTATDWVDATPVAPATPDVTVTPTTLTVTEDSSNTYTVVLDTEPSDSVTVTVGGESGDVSANPKNLTFTTGNYDTAQTVTVSAADDNDAITDAAVTLTHSASGGGYNSVSIDSVQVTVTEDDTAGVTVEPTTLSVNEGGSATYTVVLDTEPSGNVTVTVAGESGGVTANPKSLIFTTQNYNRAKTVTVSAAADENTTNETATLTHSASGGGYNSVSINSVQVTVTDTTPTLQLSTDPSAVTEGTAISLTVTSDRTLIGTLPVRLTLAARSSSGFTAADIPGTLGPRTFNANFGSSPGGTTGTVSIPTSRDTDATEGAEAYRITLNDAAGYAVGTDVTADGTLNDAAAAISLSVADASAAEGDGAMSFTVTASSAPSTAVTFKYTVTAESGDTATAGTDFIAVTAAAKGSGAIAANAQTTTITVTLTDDNDDESDETFTVTLSEPSGATISDAVATGTITDDDNTPPPTGGGGSGSGSGGGGGGGGSTSSPVPAAPTGLRRSPASAGNGQVTLTWANPGDPTIRKWQIQRREISGPTGAKLGLEAASYRPGGQPAQEGGSYGPWVDIPGSTASTTSHTVTGLTNGKTYGFRIRAVNTAGRSGTPSAEIRVTLRQPPSKPTGVTATPGNGQVTLAWTGPTDATITRWQVQQKEGSGSYGAWVDIPASTASTRSHTVTGLTNGVTYGFKIRAVNAGGNGAPSDEITATPIDQDVVQADKARRQALAATSRTLLGMATDVLGDRTGGEAPMALAGSGDSMGEQAMGVVENLLGIGGSELPKSLTLEDVEDRLWSQSFQLTPPASGMGQDWNPSVVQQRSWALWGAGELRSYRGNDDAEHLSYSGNVKTAWLGIDHPFTDRWMAGAALSFATGQSDYSYQKTDGSKDGGKMETRLTTFYPYGSFQVSQQLRLWAMAGIGWGSQHHQQTGDDDKAEGDLRLQMGVVGFERQLSPIGDVNLSLAGDAGLVKSTTDWKAGSGLDDLSVSLHRIRMGVDGSFPLAEHTTGYVNVKGRMDGGDLPMNAAELVAGVQYSQARFSGFLQGRQVYAFDGSYAESVLTAQLRLSSNSDGTGLAWTLQPSYGAGNGDVALAAGPSLWTDQQLERLTGAGAAQQEGQHLEWSSRVGYGIRLPSSDLLLTPFTEVRFWEGSSHRIGLGLTVEAASWNLEFSGSTEHTTNASPTGNLQLNFSKRL